MKHTAIHGICGPGDTLNLSASALQLIQKRKKGRRVASHVTDAGTCHACNFRRSRRKPRSRITHDLGLPPSVDWPWHSNPRAAKTRIAKRRARAFDKPQFGRARFISENARLPITTWHYRTLRQHSHRVSNRNRTVHDLLAERNKNKQKEKRDGREICFEFEECRDHGESTCNTNQRGSFL